MPIQLEWGSAVQLTILHDPHPPTASQTTSTPPHSQSMKSVQIRAKEKLLESSSRKSLYSTPSAFTGKMPQIDGLHDKTLHTIILKQLVYPQQLHGFIQTLVMIYCNTCIKELGLFNL